jgi:hypothetical protein
VKAWADGKQRGELDEEQSDPPVRPDRWFIPLNHRLEIYGRLFCSTNDASAHFSQPAFEDVIIGKISIVKRLQDFIMRTYVNECLPSQDPGMRYEMSGAPLYPTDKVIPAVNYFVDDIICMVRCLQDPIGLDGEHVLQPFDDLRKSEWDRRWRNMPNWGGKGRWEVYRRGLLHAIFGLSDNAEYNIDSTNFLLTGIFDDIKLDGNHEYGQIDIRLLDAAYIESQGPFRFTSTSSLIDHLSITPGKRIKVYVDWRALGGLRHHRILKENDARQTRFDQLFHQGTIVRPSLSRLHHHMQLSMMLLFFRNTVLRSERRKSFCSFLADLGRILIMKRGSEVIWERLAKSSAKGSPQVDDMKKRVPKDSIKDSDDWERFMMSNESQDFRANFLFRERMDQLTDVLKHWKPESLWELRYSGYGGVDKMGLGVFYATVAAGCLTIVIAVTAAILQTYTGFKALHLPSK